MSIPKQVLDLAATQGGYVTREQLVDLGLSSSAIDRRVNSGDLTLWTPGVYLVIPTHDYVDLLRGAVLTLPNAVVSHQAAAHLLRFPKLPDLVPTVVVPSHTTHHFQGVMVRRCQDLLESEIAEAEGLVTTNAVRTFFDLGGLLRYKLWDAIGESLVIAGMMELAAFEETTRRLARRGKPGSKHAHDFLERRAGHDPNATILERKGREVLAQGGLPSPRSEFPIPWRRGHRFDDAYPEAQVALEWDSRAWHEQRAAMAADRQRDREAAAHAWVLLRFTWKEVTERPHEIVETVGRLLQDRRLAS
jgi:hypothetical protein